MILCIMGSLYPILVNISDLNSDLLLVRLSGYVFGYPSSLSSLNLVAANDDVV